MSGLKAPQNRDGFRIAIICALTVEAENVRSMFDRCWENEGKRYGKAAGDQNAYTTGLISGHDVVLVHMSGMGTISAAQAAASLRSSYSNIELALVVGICGVVPLHPDTKEEIVLGDIIVATAITQYDFGRQYPDGFRRKKETGDNFGRASPGLRALMNKLQMRQSRQALRTRLQSLICSDEFYETNPAARYPGVTYDRLYKASYIHQHRAAVRCGLCSDNLEPCPMDCGQLGCEDDNLVVRERLRTSGVSDLAHLPEHTPHIHFGRFGSANTVMKSGIDRDNLAAADGLVAFEMEGAGVWDQHPTIVIKSACDYADSHKNKVWQAYAAAMAASFMKTVLTEWPHMDETTSARLPRPIHHLPFGQMSGFVGRVDELQRIKSSVCDTNNRSRRVISILGLGGVGKSRLALELAHQIRSEFPQHSVFWIYGATRLNMEQDMLEIGKKLAIPGIDDEGVDVMALVKQRLNNPSEDGWLLVVDNADDEELWGPPSSSDQANKSLVGYLPTASTGSIVITTRTRRIATYLSGKHVVVLGELPTGEAVELLKDSLENPHLAEDTATLELVEKLACLPLAIVQASSFLNRTQETTDTYLNLLSQNEDHIIDLLSKDFEEPQGHQRDLRPVATTWLVSFNQIRNQYPLAAHFLSSMACLSEKGIPLSLLPQHDRNSVIEAVAVLTGYSLIKKQNSQDDITTREPLYDMHRLVHICLRSWLKQEGHLARLTEESLKRVVDHFPIQGSEPSNMWKVYSSHGKRLCADPHVIHIPERYDLLEVMAHRLIFSGHHNEASDNLRSVISWRETAMGSSAKETMRAYRLLGIALIYAAEYSTAVEVLQKNIDSNIHALGGDNAEILLNMAALTSAYRCQGQFVKAEELMSEVLMKQKKLLGNEHSDTLETGDMLAELHRFQGRLEEAEVSQTENLEISKRVFGVEHLETVARMTSLALTYQRQYRHLEAEELVLKAVDLQTRQLGPEHLNTQHTIHTLALLYSNQGQLAKAEELLTEVIQYARERYGTDHPEVLLITNNLALVYMAQGRHLEAHEMFADSWETGKRVHGTDHPNTLLYMSNLAESLKALNRDDEARDLMETCVDLRCKFLGPENRLTRVSQNLLAEWSEAEVEVEAEAEPGEGAGAEVQVELVEAARGGSQRPHFWRHLWKRHRGRTKPGHSQGRDGEA